MNLTGEFQVQVPPEAVMTVLRNAGAIGACMPGMKSVSERDDGGVNVEVMVGVAAIRGRMRFRLFVEDEGTQDEVVYRANGSGVGSQVDVRASIRVAPSDEGTSLSWTGEVRTGGPLASIGAGMMTKVTEENVSLLMANIEQKVSEVAH